MVFDWRAIGKRFRIGSETEQVQTGFGHIVEMSESEAGGSGGILPEDSLVREMPWDLDLVVDPHVSVIRISTIVSGRKKMSHGQAMDLYSAQRGVPKEKMKVLKKGKTYLLWFEEKDEWRDIEGRRKRVLVGPALGATLVSMAEERGWSGPVLWATDVQGGNGETSGYLVTIFTDKASVTEVISLESGEEDRWGQAIQMLLADLERVYQEEEIPLEMEGDPLYLVDGRSSKSVIQDRFSSENHVSSGVPDVLTQAIRKSPEECVYQPPFIGAETFRKVGLKRIQKVGIAFSVLAVMAIVMVKEKDSSSRMLSVAEKTFRSLGMEYQTEQGELSMIEQVRTDIQHPPDIGEIMGNVWKDSSLLKDRTFYIEVMPKSVEWSIEGQSVDPILSKEIRLNLPEYMKDDGTVTGEKPVMIPNSSMSPEFVLHGHLTRREGQE